MQNAYWPKIWLAVAVIVLGSGGGLVTSTLVASNAYIKLGQQQANRSQSMTVTGSARKRIKSDLAVWRIQVQSEADNLVNAYGTLEAGVKRVRKFLNDGKFLNEEISQASVSTKVHYIQNGRQQVAETTRKVDTYSLKQSIIVTSKRVEDIAKFAGEITNLLKEGVQVISHSPEYHYTSLPDLKIEMIGQASKDAKRRIDEVARNAGFEVTEISNARVGVFQITQPHSTEVSGYGVLDTSSIEKDVRSVVGLTVRIKTK